MSALIQQLSATAAIDRFTHINRLRLATFFTPIERADRLRQLIPGAPQLYIKRDDLTGYLGGGNKLRKLEYVMADVIAKGATTVITTGAITSNHVRTTAMVARRLGLKCVLVLNGEDFQTAKANARITDLLGVRVHLVSAREDRNPKIDEVATALEADGERVYKIPLGASDEIGSFGLVAAMEELCIQQSESGTRFDAIILASSSLGTQAGLEVGKRLFDQDHLQVIGISPGGPAENAKQPMLAIINTMLRQLDLPLANPTDLNIDDRFAGPGYGIPSTESEQAARLFAEAEGILLDPVYTSKAAAALINYSRERKFKQTDRVLFWHTGGQLSLL
jgi:D-cysteine desulfhydrase family pyridoxal phosphate-dependent enzyme